MNEKEYAQAATQALESCVKTIDDLKKCLFSRNKRQLSEIRRNLAVSVKASLPLFEEAMEKKEKSGLDQWLVELLPPLQRLGIALEDLLEGVQMAVDAEISLTDKAMGEVNEMMALLKDLARDTNDVLSTKNAHFRAYAVSSAEHVLQRTAECGVEHQQRLIVGVCSPKASFLYLNVMDSMKRIAKELGALCEKA